MIDDDSHIYIGLLGDWRTFGSLIVLAFILGAGLGYIMVNF